jgi:O-antigen/teichoic acid export membrane protein
MNIRTKALRNTMFSSVGIYTEYVLGMLTSIFIARHLGPSEFGAYGAIIWLVAMGVAMTNAGTASAVIKFVAELRGAGREDLIAPTITYLRRAQRWFMLIVLVGGGVVFGVAGDRFAPGFNHIVLYVFFVLAIALRAQYMFNVGVAKGFEDFRAIAIVALVATPLNLAMVVGAWWLDAEVEALLVVFVLSGIVFYAMSRARTRPLIPPALPGVVLPDDLRKRLLRHMRLVAVTVTVGFLVASDVEVFFLTMFADAAAAGHFKVAYQLASGAATLVPGVIGALLLPMMANALSQGRDVAGRRFIASTSFLMLLAAPLAAFGAVFSGPIILLMYGSAYAASIPVFAVCLGACALAAVSQGGSSLLVSADRQGTVLALAIACGVLKVVLDVWLIHAGGLAGATAAYLIVAVVNASAFVLIAMRAVGARLEWGRLLRILIAATLSALALAPLRGHWPPLPTLLVAGAAMVGVYALLSLVLRCWSAGDIEHLQQLHQRYARSRPRALARLLAWSGRVPVKEVAT